MVMLFEHKMKEMLKFIIKRKQMTFYEFLFQMKRQWNRSKNGKEINSI